MNTEEKRAIRERSEKATPGPWKHNGGNLGWAPFWYTTSDDGVHATQDDAEFVTHARTDIPALLADNDRLHVLAQRLAEAANKVLNPGDTAGVCCGCPMPELREAIADYEMERLPV